MRACIVTAADGTRESKKKVMPVVTLRDVSKSFGATQALSSVSFELNGGEVHALLGENGAGKSTLVKILSGVLQPDVGEVLLVDEYLPIGSPRAVVGKGVSTAFQELSLLPNLTVAENLLLPELPRNSLGLVSGHRVRRQALQILERYDLADIDPDTPVSLLTLASKQRLEIVKAFNHEPKLLILDEPTAALTDTEWLFRHVSNVTKQGTAVLYISHRLNEIRQICDRGTVLRNGSVVGSFMRAEFDESRLISMMIGRSLDTAFPPNENTATEEAMVEVRELSVGNGVLESVSLTLNKGEVVGIAALEGQGQRELFQSLYGLRRPSGGEVLVEDKPVQIRSPRRALKTGPGIALVPEERKSEALFLELSARKNLILSTLGKVSTSGFVRPRLLREYTSQEAGKVNVDPMVLDRPVGRLSGGNQQKVAIGKAVLTGARCLLLFDPARGIDAATKLEVYDLIRRLAAEGNAVLMYSSELPELVGLCDRVYALYGGRVAGEYTGEDLTEHNLLTAAVGHAEVPANEGGVV